MSVEGRWRRILTVLALAELAGVLESTLMFSALPTALRSYPDAPSVSWLITGYFLVAAASAAICGRLGDTFGRSRVMLAVLGLATIGSILSIVSTDLGWIIVGRSIQGFAGAVLPLCYGLAREMLPKDKVALGVGIITGTGSIAAAGGYVIGGLIVDSMNWQHIFTCSALLASFALILCYAMLPRSTPIEREGGIDVVGGILFVPGLAAILWAVNRAQTMGWATTAQVGWIFGGATLLLFWVRHELRHPDPLIDVRLLGKSGVAMANLTIVFGTLGALQVLQIFPLLLQQPAWTGVGFGLSATLTGILKIPSNVASFFGGWSGGALNARFGDRNILILGAAMCLIGWGGLIPGHSILWLTIILVCISSAGNTMMIAAAITRIIGVVPHERTSEAAGMTIVFRTMCQGIGGQIVLLILSSKVVQGSSAGRSPSPDAWHHALAYVSLMCACALAAAVLVPRPKPGTL